MADRAPTMPMFRRPTGSLFRRGRSVRRSGPVTALDVEGKVLRVAQAAIRGDRTVITRLEVAELNLDESSSLSDPQPLGEAIAGVLRDLRLKPAQVAMGVPRHSVILRTLTLPPVGDVRELASIVHMQVGKDLPFRQEEAVIDFKVCEPITPTHSSDPSAGQRPSGAPGQSDPAAGPAKLEVLVAAVRRETVDFYQKVAAAAQLKLVALGWLSEANARSFQACQLARGNEAVAVVSLRPDEVGIDIIAGHSLVFSRGASFSDPVDTAPAEPLPAETESTLSSPAPGPAPGETFVNSVTIEVVRTLHSYGGSEATAPVAQLLIAGATGQEEVVLEALRQRLNIPCSLFDPVKPLDLPEQGRHHAAGAIGVLGLALGANDAEGLPFDFQSPKRPAVQRNMRRIRTLALSAAGVALLMGLLGARAHMINQRMKGSGELQQELAEAEKKVPTYRKMQQQAATVQNWAKQGRNWLEHYAYLSAVLPGSEDLYITSMSISGQGNIHLAVQARSGEILANLDRQLRAAGYEVKPLAVSPGNDKHGYNFRSTVELIVPGKMQIDLSKVQPPARPPDDTGFDSRAANRRKGGPS